MEATIDFIPVFRQKIGNVYHFDLLAVHSTVQTYVIGYALLNSKTWEVYAALPDGVEWDESDTEETIVETVKELEKVFSDS